MLFSKEHFVDACACCARTAVYVTFIPDHTTNRAAKASIRGEKLQVTMMPTSTGISILAMLMDVGVDGCGCVSVVKYQ
jgi:hypothetical protein